MTTEYMVCELLRTVHFLLGWNPNEGILKMERALIVAESVWPRASEHDRLEKTCVIALQAMSGDYGAARQSIEELVKEINGTF